MNKIIYLLLSVLIMAGCSKNDNDRRVEYTHRTVFFGYVYIEDFGGVHMMADTLTNDRFEILVPKYLAELIPDVISNFDLEHTYEDINYEFYTLYPLKRSLTVGPSTVGTSIGINLLEKPVRNLSISFLILSSENSV